MYAFAVIFRMILTPALQNPVMLVPRLGPSSACVNEYISLARSFHQRRFAAQQVACAEAESLLSQGRVLVGIFPNGEVVVEDDSSPKGAGPCGLCMENSNLCPSLTVAFLVASAVSGEGEHENKL
jgi:hypothetical protein